MIPDWRIAVIFLLAVGAAAATGSVFGPGEWYERLNKAPWTPPPWVFPVAWTLLYLAMALAASRVAVVPGAGVALALFALQIALNTLWTPVFFGAHRTGMGLLILCALWLAVAAMLVAFWRIDRLAGALIAPYLVWLTLAGSLNFWIWRYNPDL